jgi:hypothetical protein
MMPRFIGLTAKRINESTRESTTARMILWVEEEEALEIDPAVLDSLSCKTSESECTHKKLTIKSEITLASSLTLEDTWKNNSS